jgi:hypothetical protein
MVCGSCSRCANSNQPRSAGTLHRCNFPQGQGDPLHADVGAHCWDGAKKSKKENLAKRARHLSARKRPKRPRRRLKGTSGDEKGPLPKNPLAHSCSCRLIERCVRLRLLRLLRLLRNARTPHDVHHSAVPENSIRRNGLPTAIQALDYDSQTSITAASCRRRSVPRCNAIA